MASPHPTSSNSQRNYTDSRAVSHRLPLEETAKQPHAVSQTAIDNGITTRRVTADEIAFRDGYVQGREQERRIQQHNQRRMQHIYAQQGMVGGLLTGILLTLTVGFIATMLAVFSPQWETDAPQNSTSQTVR